MLQKSFFKTDVLNPTKITNVLLYSQENKTTYSKGYRFVVPEGYNNVVIEYAGGSGGEYGYQIVGGGGSIKRLSIDIKQGSSLVIEGVIGGFGDFSTSSMEAPIGTEGGQGYSNGEDGFSGDGTVDYVGYISGGAGGGSTSVVVNGSIYEASGGGGAASWEVNTGYGGAGGGAFGGARKNSKKTSDKNSIKGNDATDPEQIGLNKSSSWHVGGYIKVYGNYDPYL